MNSILHYNQSTELFDEALPLGNGRLGAMVYGQVKQEKLLLNEDSCWYGKYLDRNNNDALKNLEKIRQLTFDGEIKDAERLLGLAFVGTPESQRHYQPLGFFNSIYDLPDGEVKNYKRSLDVSTATAKVTFSLNNVDYTREYYVSYPHQVIAIVQTTSLDGMLNYSQSLNRARYYDNSYSLDNNTIAIHADNNGIKLCAMARTISKDGTVETIGDSIVVKNATKTVTYIAGNTTFNESNLDDIIACQKKCINQLDNAFDICSNKLKDAHIKDYTSLYNKMSLEMSNNTNVPDTTTTDVRLKNYSLENEDLGLLCLYFNFGRYLMISGSRKGSLPLNLQGIWNDLFMPPWDSKYTININTEMNYWPAECCNLSECHTPLFDMIKRMVKNGKVTAKTMYNCRGFVAHHNTDIWADTAPQDNCTSSTFWVMGGAWLSLHMIYHYEYNKDTSFANDIFDIIKEACLFFIDYLVLHDGVLVTCPSTSPENLYSTEGDTYKKALSYGVTMDNEILRDLFNGLIMLDEALNRNDKITSKIREILPLLPPIKIGKEGQILEWINDYKEDDLGHRHVSHLFGLYPSSQIDLEKTPDLAQAAKISLERRLANGGGHTGWSRAWLINLWARLQDKEQIRKNIFALFNSSTLINLLDNHPPFQIDGNFGATAGIAEMLLQSQSPTIKILPALPSTYLNGCVKGIKARGNLTFNFTWENLLVTSCEVYAEEHTIINVLVNGDVKTIETKKGEYITIV